MRSRRDDGISLVEVVIAVVLSGIVGGVIVAALATSLNAADQAATLVADSTDQALISTYLARDAQAAAGTDPTTARIERRAAVAVPAGGGDMAACVQDGSFVARFAWIDRSVSVDREVATTWSLHPDGRLIRRSCDANGTVDLVLGQVVSSAVASCTPQADCTGSPSSISLEVTTTSGARFTSTASLRGDLQEPPRIDTAEPVPLLVIGEQSATGACPVLDLGGTGVVRVLGGAVISSSCGASPVAGDQTLLAVADTTSMISGVSDPFADLVPPAHDCSVDSRLAPGASPGAAAVVVHAARVTLSGTTTFQPGLHVFCNGLTVSSGATVTGTGTLWYLPVGGLTIDPTATIDLAAPTSGAYRNLVLWDGGRDGITLGAGTIDSFRGTVYVPRARVTLAVSTSLHLGAVAAAEVRVSGAGGIRIGMPIPTLATAVTALPTGQVGVTYPTTPVAITGGTAPYSFRVSGLPPGLTASPSGIVTGTPTAFGSFTADVVVAEATGFQQRFLLPVSIREPVTIAAPAGLPNGQAGIAYTSTTMTAAGGLAPYSWTANGLPAGMTMSAAGRISGTPTSPGSFTVTVVVADAAAGVASRSFAFTVAPSAVASDPFSPAQRFQLVTERNATLASFGMDGAAAVGGNLVFRNYHGVAAAEASTLVRTSRAAGLVVGGVVDLTGSGSGSQLTVGSGLFHVGGLGSGALTTWGTNVHLAPAGVNDNWSTPRVIVTADQTNQTTDPVVLPGTFDTAAAFSQFRATSASLGALDPATCSSISAPTVTSQYGNFTLTLAPGRVNVWNLTMAQINAMVNVSGPINVGVDTPLVVNVVDGGAIAMPQRYWSPLRDGARSAIMWNFPNATAVNVSGVFYGSIFAPNAAVTIDNVSFTGDVVAASAVLTSGTYALAHWTTPVPCTLGALSVYGPSRIADGQVGVASSATMVSSGGSPPVTWSATGLPPGLTLTAGGILSGTPTTAGPYNVAVRVTDSTGAASTRSYAFTVRSALAVTGPASLPAGVVGAAYTPTSFTASGGLAPLTWSATGLPAGLTLSSTGQLSGTPSVNGTFTVAVTVRDAANATAVRSSSMTVTGAVCPSSTKGWRGEYFENMTLTAPAAVCRDDATVDFSWGTAAPATGVRSDNFSVRWTRTVSFSAGTYRFTAGADDGMRLFVDGKLVLDQWVEQSYTTTTAIVDIAEGSRTIVFEVYENFGDAAATLTWSPIVPASCPRADPDKWTMEIYDGTTVSGVLVDCRSESNLKYDWGTGTPESRVGNDTFSVRWTRTWSFSAGTYRFVAGSDDGVRVWVDGVRVIDTWGDRSYATSSATVDLAAGNRTVIMEYYENGGFASADLVITRL